MFLSSLFLAASLTITAGGDAFMVQGFPKGFKLDTALTEWIGSGDVRLVNFHDDGVDEPAERVRIVVGKDELPARTLVLAAVRVRIMLREGADGVRIGIHHDA